MASRRLVEGEDKVSDLTSFFERMNKPTLAPKDANPIPSIDSSSEEPTRPEHMPELVNRDAHTSRRLVEGEDKVSDLISFFERMNKPTLAPKDANPLPSIDSSSEEPTMPKPVLGWGKDANTIPSRRRLVEGEETVSDLISFFERMNKPTLAPK